MVCIESHLLHICPPWHHITVVSMLHARFRPVVRSPHPSRIHPDFHFHLHPSIHCAPLQATDSDSADDDLQEFIHHPGLSTISNPQSGSYPILPPVPWTLLLARPHASAPSKASTRSLSLHLRLRPAPDVGPERDLIAAASPFLEEPVDRPHCAASVPARNNIQNSQRAPHILLPKFRVAQPSKFQFFSDQSPWCSVIRQTPAAKTPPWRKSPLS
jgi:hypothetical protein